MYKFVTLAVATVVLVANLMPVTAFSPSARSFRHGSFARSTELEMTPKHQQSLFLAGASLATCLVFGEMIPSLQSPSAADPLASSPIAPIPSVVVSGVEIVPSGGGGFGGLGISPFGVGPFGGFGFGFGVRSTADKGVTVRKLSDEPRQLTKDEVVERAKAELEATRMKEKQLDRIIQELAREKES